MKHSTDVMNAAMVLGLAASVGLPLPARADFTIHTGVMRSAGPVGNAGNSVMTYTYSGPDAIVTTSEFGGAISSLIRGTLISEARWSVRNTRYGTSGIGIQTSRIGSFENSVLVLAYPGSALFVKDGDTITFETYEMLDDGPGADAAWNNVTWTWATTIPTEVGAYESVATISTEGGAGFGTDTELALYSEDGALLGWNDDDGPGSSSTITNLRLPIGRYFVAVMPSNSWGNSGVLTPGFQGLGEFDLLVDGSRVASGTLDAYSTFWYSFTVGPTGPDCPADFNGDGFVDFFDFDDFVAGFEAGC